MLPKLTSAIWLSLIVAMGLCLPACPSSEGRRDMNYGTDVAVGFVPPDGATSPSADAALDMAQSVDGAAASPDGGAVAEVSVDEGN
jgi:energy-converting hydrogenase Eha subunit B